MFTYRINFNQFYDLGYLKAASNLFLPCDYAGFQNGFTRNIGIGSIDRSRYPMFPCEVSIYLLYLPFKKLTLDRSLICSQVKSKG